MSGRLAGKSAVITAGADGIGWGIAERFLEEGAQVVVADVDPVRGDLAGARAHAMAAGERFRFIAADATQAAPVTAAIALAVAAFGRLDCMVNNAGGPGPSLGGIIDTAPVAFDATIALTLRSAYLGIHLAARQFLAQGGGGVILSTGSISAHVGGAGPAIYGAAKAALANLSRSAAAELAPHGIRVNTISPGLILTPTFEASGATPEFAATLQPLPVAGCPRDIGNAAVFLASDEARFVAGSDLVVDGAAMAGGIDLYRKLIP